MLSPTELPLDRSLPPLRDDLRIWPGGRDYTGMPVWIVHDPVRHRFFQLGEREFFLLSAWEDSTPADIIVEADFEVPITAEEIKEFIDFLLQAELLRASTPGISDRLRAIGKAREMVWWKQLVHKYLFFRIPLIKPDRLLSFLHRRGSLLFSNVFLAVTILFGVVGAYLTLRQWGTFLSGFSDLFTANGSIVFVATLVVIKVMHELGHGLMARHFGLRVPSMGVAFMVMWPILYTDASDAWRLTSRKRKALVSSAGIITESLIMCYALFLWAVLPEGLARSVAFSAVTTVWVGSLLVNLNPVMKFDGYYLLSDLLNMPNLQDRSFVLAKWRLRSWVLGVVESCPEEDVGDGLSRFMIGYAFFVWLYRLVLFLGIALLVYHFFFKALGIVLFLIEIWWFIVGPIWREVSRWPARRVPVKYRRFWGGALAVVLFVLLFPFRPNLQLPAILMDADLARVYLRRDAIVEQVHVMEGQKVVEGQLLMSLSSPELEYQLASARLDVLRIENAIIRRSSDSSLYESRLVLESELERAQTTLSALEQQKGELDVRAASSGRIVDLKPSLRVGMVMGREMHLFSLAQRRHVKALAWANEQQAEFLTTGQQALFYPEEQSIRAYWHLNLSGIDRAPVKQLDPPYQASQFGGEVATLQGEGGGLVPVSGVYKVNFSEEVGKVEAGMIPDRVLRGSIVVHGKRQPYLIRFFYWSAGIFIRESGF